MKTTFNYVANGKRIGTIECESTLEAIKQAGDVLTGYFSHMLGIDDFENPTYINIEKSDDSTKFVTYGIIKNNDCKYEAKMLTYSTNEVLFTSESVGDAFDYLVRHYYLAVGAAFTEIN